MNVNEKNVDGVTSPAVGVKKPLTFVSLRTIVVASVGIRTTFVRPVSPVSVAMRYVPVYVVGSTVTTTFFKRST